MITIRVHPAGTGTDYDANGDLIEVPATPFDLEVYAVYPRVSEEPGDANRDLVITGRTILAPETATVSERDQIDVDLDGVLWNVDGRPRRWDQRSNPLRTGGFRYARAAFPSRRVGCLEINVEDPSG